MHVGAIQEGQRVLLVDDLIATGGTLREPSCACTAWPAVFTVPA
jgi:adenine/guanine phosphoribosyltransferase-like PRPP-binding protein